MPKTETHRAVNQKMLLYHCLPDDWSVERKVRKLNSDMEVIIDLEEVETELFTDDFEIIIEERQFLERNDVSVNDFEIPEGCARE